MEKKINKHQKVPLGTEEIVATDFNPLKIDQTRTSFKNTERQADKNETNHLADTVNSKREQSPVDNLYFLQN